MTRDEIAAIVIALGDLVQIVRDADPADKSKIYTQLGLTLAYQLRRHGGSHKQITTEHAQCPRGDLNPETGEISQNLDLNSKTGEKSPDGGVHVAMLTGHPRFAPTRYRLLAAKQGLWSRLQGMRRCSRHACRGAPVDSGRGVSARVTDGARRAGRGARYPPIWAVSWESARGLIAAHNWIICKRMIRHVGRRLACSRSSGSRRFASDRRTDLLIMVSGSHLHE
jgi:hypothetical protein